jgi:WD40 repeat protein
MSPGPQRNNDRPTSLAFDAQGRLVAHDVQELRVWPAGPLALQTPPEVRIQLPMLSRPSLARTSDGRFLALLRSTSVSLWRSETPGRLFPVIPPRREGAATAPATPPPAAGNRARPNAGGDSLENRFRAIQIGPGGRRLYLVDALAHLHVWEIAGSPEDAELHAIESHRKSSPIESISSIALRPDGEILAVGDRSGSGTVTLIGTKLQTVVGSIKPAGDEAETFNLNLALAFSPDGRTLAVGSQQGIISLYAVDAPSRPRLRLRLPGHSGLVTHLAFDTPGTRLATTATAGNDYVVEVWDLDLIRRELAQRGLAEDVR